MDSVDFAALDFFVGAIGQVEDDKDGRCGLELKLGVESTRWMSGWAVAV